jgi:DNA-binding XRE family transcriptional regulator
MSDANEPEASISKEQLADYRRTLGYTQEQMANAMGLSRRAYLDIEGGKSPIRLLHQMALCWASVKHAAEGGGYNDLAFDIGEIVVRAARK